ncbi:uncharacterized protein M6B38_300765 [Iris pallida]|uniref:Uncharacterized protein n=1 Tax=Iris pallida TaxID=29817 RepID=A0AAX6HSF1_IRIPA|nr:uncharacterized protein M6B38_300765 [Iris pallida]
MEEHAGGGGGANSKNKETGNGVLVAYFDPSVENFLSYSDSVAALCGLPRKESFEPSEVESFYSNVTFIKEWNYFVYEPKSVKFAYQTGPGQFKDELDEISLPQFSSAAIPKIKQSPGGAKSFDGTDFVLNAGGFVWAFDWCPKGSEVHDSSIQCEYLAVAAHPPGSSYHHIGLPLFGRGVIQIWCLLTVRENMEFSQLCKGRVRKNMVQKPTYDSEGKEVPTIKRPRGRPKKPSTSRDDQDGLKETIPKKPRGRPRKELKATVNRCAQISDFKFGEKISALPTSGEFDTSSKNLVALPDSSDLNGNPSGKRRRGRPRKELKATVNSSVQTSNFEFAENISALATPTGPETLDEDMELLQTLNQYLHSSVNNHRGRARKGQISAIKKYIQASESEHGKIYLLYPLQEDQRFSMKMLTHSLF